MDINLVLGLLLMVAGLLLILVAVFRSLGHAWTLGAYDLWALPLAGVVLILVGRLVLA